MAVKLIVSGKPEDFESELTILEFLNKKNIWVDMVTVEVNDKIIPKQDYQKVSLKENDRVETVFYMGGGMVDIKINEKLDIRGVLCPMNFVKTVLKLEQMQDEEILEVLLDDGDPIANVPRSVKEEGHEIVAVDKMENGFRLLIRKKLPLDPPL